MKFRRFNEWFARTNGYFWLPCPLCGQHFGGHEWEDRNGLSSHIPDPEGRPNMGVGICPDCTLAGRGVENWWKEHDE